MGAPCAASRISLLAINEKGSVREEVTFALRAQHVAGRCVVLSAQLESLRSSQREQTR
jgi:hypothetical protein